MYLSNEFQEKFDVEHYPIPADLVVYKAPNWVTATIRSQFEDELFEELTERRLRWENLRGMSPEEITNFIKKHEIFAYIGDLPVNAAKQSPEEIADFFANLRRSETITIATPADTTHRPCSRLESSAWNNGIVTTTFDYEDTGSLIGHQIDIARKFGQIYLNIYSPSEFPYASFFKNGSISINNKTFVLEYMTNDKKPARESFERVKKLLESLTGTIEITGIENATMDEFHRLDYLKKVYEKSPLMFAALRTVNTLPPATDEIYWSTMQKMIESEKDVTRARIFVPFLKK